MSDRPCTCHPSEAPKLCQKMYALGECQAADEIERLRVALEEIDHGWESPMDDKAYRALCRFMWETARAALGEQQ